jgi:hypothetical protein
MVHATLSRSAHTEQLEAVARDAIPTLRAPRPLPVAIEAVAEVGLDEPTTSEVVVGRFVRAVTRPAGPAPTS